MKKKSIHIIEGRKKERKNRTNGMRKEGRKEQRNLPRIKLLIAPMTNDVKTARPLSHRYDIL